MSSPPNHTEVFEYALIRVVPRVERGEAINAGRARLLQILPLPQAA